MKTAPENPKPKKRFSRKGELFYKLGQMLCPDYIARLKDSTINTASISDLQELEKAVKTAEALPKD